MLIPARTTRAASVLLAVASLCCLAACGTDAEDDSNVELDVFDASTDTDAVVSLPCPQLFGAPAENTGLGDGVCQTECACAGQEWTPTQATDAELANWRAWSPAQPWPRTEGNPYRTEAPEREPGIVCALTFDHDAGTYMLESTPEDAVSSDASVTHSGPCGACSSLQDLAVYAGVPDLTTPVRQCGLEGARNGVDAAETCIADIGFSNACSQIWAFNAMNTLDVCLETCFALLNSPYHEEDGRPNACIQCDEDNSGPVFKAIAGRTRRNSGLPTALCRPCDTVSQIRHDIPAAP